MQPQIPQKQNLLQSRRFLTHHPTFSPTPTPAFAGIKFKQEEGKMPSQPMIPNNITNNSTPNPPGSISHFTASCLDWMNSAFGLIRSVLQRPFLVACICTIIAIVVIPYTHTLHTSTQLSGFLLQTLQYQFPAYPSITCPLGLCKAEGTSQTLDEPQDLTVWPDGACAVEEFTSPTFSESSKDRWNLWSKNPPAIHWAGPIAVLDPQISCWSFEGSSGFITIQLVGNASITSVQIAHAAEPYLQKFAPRDFVVWALVDSGSFSIKEIPHHITPPPNLERLVSNGFYPIHLGTFSFEAISDGTSQSFTTDVRALGSYGSRIDKVMFHVLSNWGAKRTCLYHLRVFGRL